MTPRERLTPKEIQIAILVREGMTNRKIGRMIGTSEQVIKNHLRNTFDKLVVRNHIGLSHRRRRRLPIKPHSPQKHRVTAEIRKKPLCASVVRPRLVFAVMSALSTKTAKLF